MQSSTELKCFKGLVYFYVVLLSVSVTNPVVVRNLCFVLLLRKQHVGELQHFQGDQVFAYLKVM